MTFVGHGDDTDLSSIVLVLKPLLVKMICDDAVSDLDSVVANLALNPLNLTWSLLTLRSL